MYGKYVDVVLDHVWPRIPTTSPLGPAFTACNGPEEGEEDNWIFISGHRAAALALLRCLFSMSRSFFRLAQLVSSIVNQPSIFLCFCDVAPVSTVSRVVKVSWY
jgi:hypothetical protein